LPGVGGAVARSSSAVELDPKIALAWCHRGIVHREFHPYEKALADYSEAIKLDAKLALAWYHRGYLHVTIHQYRHGSTE